MTTIQIIQNIYTYIISISGIIGLVALTWGGVLYLTSAGKPEKLDQAKKQIFSALLGIIILLSSYIILKTINPELVELQLPRLKDIIFSPLDLPPPETKVPKLLSKIREIADQLKENIVPGIENSSQKIKESTDKCNCENTQSLCFCAGGSESSECKARGCYAGPGFQPCPGEKEIKENQQNIIAWKDEILYYRNRAVAEEDDLNDEIKKVLDEKILYYIKNEQIEEDEKVKQYLKDERQKVTDEKNLKKDLGAKLKELADLIEKISAPILVIGPLPDQCLINVETKCTASCKGKCHDYKQGCQPDKCSGGNPCPIDEIKKQYDEIQNLKPSIIQSCDEIINIIDKIIKFKTITI